MISDDQSREQQNALLHKPGFHDAYDLLTKDLREPANDEAQVTLVPYFGLYGGGLR
jgi:hypothetical protein